MTAKGIGGRWWTLSGRSLGLGSQPHMFVLWLFKGGSHICFGSVFLNIPALLVVIFLMKGILNEKKTQVIGYSILRFDIIYSYQKKRHTSSLR
jgi:hypothetical protein